MRLIQEYAAKASAAEKKFFLEQTPKQQLILLQKADLLTPLQVTAAARRFDALMKAGAPDAKAALAAVLEELIGGKLTIGVPDPKAPANLLKLTALREKQPGLSSKQQLLELRNAGSLSPDQTRRAAQLMAKGHSVEQALVGVDAAVLLGTIPAPADLAVDETPADADEGEEEDEDEKPTPAIPNPDAAPDPNTPPPGADDPDPTAEELADATKARTLAGLLDKSVAEIEKDLEKVKAGSAVIELYCLEMAGKTRSTLLPVLLKKGEEFGLTKETFDSAWETYTIRVKSEMNLDPKGA